MTERISGRTCTSVTRRTFAEGTDTRDTGNALLDRLSETSHGEVLHQARCVQFRQDAVVFSPGEVIREVLFPITAVCSLLIGLASGKRAETGTIGNEGMVGEQAVLGTRAAEYGIVQIPGEALVVSSEDVRRLFNQNDDFRKAVLRYLSYAQLVTRQSVACNAYHSIEQRTARWLLTAGDRAHRDTFPLTQELLSHMVAASRPRVSEAVSRLVEQRAIRYSRGVVHIEDRERLRQASCECYEATKVHASRRTVVAP